MLRVGSAETSLQLRSGYAWLCSAEASIRLRLGFAQASLRLRSGKLLGNARACFASRCFASPPTVPYTSHRQHPHTPHPTCTISGTSNKFPHANSNVLPGGGGGGGTTAAADADRLTAAPKSPPPPPAPPPTLLVLRDRCVCANSTPRPPPFVTPADWIPLRNIPPSWCVLC